MVGILKGREGMRGARGSLEEVPGGKKREFIPDGSVLLHCERREAIFSKGQEGIWCLGRMKETSLLAGG